MIISGIQKGKTLKPKNRAERGKNIKIKTIPCMMNMGHTGQSVDMLTLLVSIVIIARDFKAYKVQGN